MHRARSIGMDANIRAVRKTVVYSIEDGCVAIEQEDAVVLLEPDELLVVIRELQDYYDNRHQWQEPTPS